MPATKSLFRWFLAFVLAVAVTPAFAQNVKYFTLAEIIAPATTGNPSSWSPPAASPTVSTSVTQITIAFTNIANGNSNFSSASVVGTGSGGASVKILSATSSRGGTPSQSALNSWTFTNTGPVKKNETLFMTLTVELKTTGCSNGQILWSGTAWTGSVSNPSTNFQQQNVPGPSMTVSAGCAYSYTVTPTLFKGDKDVTLTATISNPSGSPATIESVTLTPPAGITPSGPTAYAVSIAPGTQGSINITASAPCDAAGAGGAWTSSVTGYSLSGGEQSTAVAGNCKLAFSEAPASVISGDVYTAKVKLYNDAVGGSTISTFVGSVGLSATATGCTLDASTTTPRTAVSGVATFNDLKLNATTTTTLCKLKGSTTIGTTAFETAELQLPVFDATLACQDTSTFDALDMPPNIGDTGAFFDEAGPAAPGQTGFIAGIRVKGKGSKETRCDTLINYSLFNNIAATSGILTDPAENKVYPGFYSFSFDSSIVTSPVVAIMSTYRPEWSDKSTGLPARKTLICTVTPCQDAPYNLDGTVNTLGGWKEALVCLSTIVHHDSIPSDAGGGCVAKETWWPVASASCTETPPSGTWPNLRCLQPTATMIIGKDPIVGR